MITKDSVSIAIKIAKKNIIYPKCVRESKVKKQTMKKDIELG